MTFWKVFMLINHKIYKKFVDTLDKADNVYPPYKYQQFINNKCSYIKHFEKN